MKTKTPRSPRRIAAGLCGFIALEPVQYSHTHDRNRHPELVEGTCGCYRYRGLEENRHHELVEATCGCYRYHGLEENCHPERVRETFYIGYFIDSNQHKIDCVGTVRHNCADFAENRWKRVGRKPQGVSRAAEKHRREPLLPVCQVFRIV
jgi:hypothetical protein